VVEEVKEKRTAARLTTKSYEHMLDRMKKDQIRAQMRRNELERDIKRTEKQLAELTAKVYELKEYEFLSTSGLKEAEDEVRELEALRQSTVADMHSILEEKEVLGRKRQERKEKSDMIKEMAAGDLQDADLIRMKRFLTVQSFLKSLLKAKMERLKDFYSPY
jgi:chromosome segregation ATPase